LRLVLSGAHALRAMLNGRRLPALGTLRSQAREAWDLTHAGRYTDLTGLLRGLIPDLETAARTVRQSQRAEVCQLLAATYQGCAPPPRTRGRPDPGGPPAAPPAPPRGRENPPSPAPPGASGLVFFSPPPRHYDQAEETARTAADALQPLADQGDPQAMSLWGALTLQRAVTASRVSDPDAAYRHLERARQIADQLGEGRNDYNTEFGPANVGLHEIAVAVELGDAGRAVRTAASVNTAGLSAERRARMLIDVARAHAQRRQVQEAVAALRQAEDITPEQVRTHGAGRQPVPDLPTMRDPPTSELRDLAGRLAPAKLSI